MGIKSTAKKIGKAIIFQKLYSDIKTKVQESNDEEIVKLRELIEQWKEEAAEDLNYILATILIEANEAMPEDIRADVDSAKENYTAENPELTPWFESQIDAIIDEKEAEAAAEEEAEE